MDKTGIKLLFWCVEAMNSNEKEGGNVVTWYKFKFAVWRKHES